MANTSPTPTSSPIPANKEIRIISHSTLYYWWPVWAVGFLMAIMSMFSDYRMVIVPENTMARGDVDLGPLGISKVEGKHDVLILPKGERLQNDPNHTAEEVRREPYLHINNSKNPGVFFFAVLLLVIFITNVPLRGLWSVIVIVLIVALTIIFGLLHWWDIILGWVRILDIRINEAGYFVISTGLFIMWLIVFFLFDQQIYMVFTPGQLRVRLEIGGAETAYDTTGMTIQKQRSDLFRHWILGLGSGDLIVTTTGAQSHTFDMPNVLFLGRQVRAIEDMLRAKEVVSGRS